MVEKGFARRARRVTDCILKSGNRYGKPQSTKQVAAKKRQDQSRGRHLYFAGCRAAFDDLR